MYSLTCIHFCIVFLLLCIIIMCTFYHLPFVCVHIVKLPHRSMIFWYLYSINMKRRFVRLLNLWWFLTFLLVHIMIVYVFYLYLNYFSYYLIVFKPFYRHWHREISPQKTRLYLRSNIRQRLGWLWRPDVRHKSHSTHQLPWWVRGSNP